ncbi:hypothetical protein M5K25_019616 [Dendrobium thyrsiflorum]|uniref:Uncharacterized protein n=1 Tax=Dendrobium thyrsiflorum TaxID=117978 RepID=A0ABD0UMA0_DENTH
MRFVTARGTVAAVFLQFQEVKLRPAEELKEFRREEREDKKEESMGSGEQTAELTLPLSCNKSKPSPNLLVCKPNDAVSRDALSL